jgi:methyltransferase-like protein/SAM-dependent methyltransferase
MSSYDEIPYPSYAFASTVPEKTSAIGLMFGLKPGQIESAKVLEIGCASGGNLIPFAERFPDATCLGVDMSQKQISAAEKIRDELELKNLTFRAASILDFDFVDEKYDYIIVHGVYSWVSDVVQNRILEICGQNLARNGIAYISYNTLPGWNGVKTVRDMMLYHSKSFSDPMEKVLEARRMLAFAHENIVDDAGPYKLALDQEIKVLSKADDAYLFHDHLEEVNEPSYFYEFMALADKQGLGYLGDTNISSMYIGNQKKEAAEKLSEITEIVRQEQYSDFLTNRRFRMTLLVHKDAELNRKLGPAALDDLSFIPNYTLTENIDEIQTVEKLDLKNIANGSLTATITGKYLSGIYLQMLLALPLYSTKEGVLKSVGEMYSDASNDDLEKVWNENILNFVVKGFVEAVNSPIQPKKKISDKPCICASARLQALSSGRVTNLKHQTVHLDDGQRMLVPLLDGIKSRAEIIKTFADMIEESGAELNSGGTKIARESSDYQESLEKHVDAQMMILANNSLLQS